MVIRAFVHLIKVGRQSFAAKQSVNARRLQPPPVGMGMPTYIAAVDEGVSTGRRIFLQPKRYSRRTTRMMWAKSP